MKRRSINPVDWSLPYSMDLGEVVEGATKHLRCSGQISVDPAPDTELGVAVVSPNDLRGQMEHTFLNIDSVLEKVLKNPISFFKKKVSISTLTK